MKNLSDKSREGLEDFINDGGNLIDLDQAIAKKINHHDAPTSSKQGISKSIIIILALLVSALVAFAIYNYNNNINADQLYAQYYEDFDHKSEVIRGDKDLLDHDTQKSDLIAGLNAMENGHFDIAIDKLKRLHVSDNQYQDIASWYLSLAYIKSDDLPNAKAVLQSIISNQSYKKSEAVELLKDLDSLPTK